MVLDWNNLKILAERQGFKSAKVYASHDPLHSHSTEKNNYKRAHIELMNTGSTNELLKELEFYRDQSGEYTIEFAKSSTTITTNPKQILVSFPVQPAQIIDTTLQGHAQPHAGDNLQKLKEEMKAQVIAEIRAEEEAKRKAEEIEDMRRQLREYETQSGKLAAVFGQMLKQYLPDLMGQNSMAMQGTPEPNQTQKAQHQGVDRDALNKALGKLISEFGAQAIIDLANNPERINMLKQFI